MKKILFVILFLPSICLASDWFPVINCYSNATDTTCDTLADACVLSSKGGAVVAQNSSMHYSITLFTAQTSQCICQADLNVYDVSGSENINFVAEIWTSTTVGCDGGAAECPDTQTGSSSNIVNSSSFGASSTSFTSFPFSSCINITAGTNYWLVLEASSYTGNQNILWETTFKCTLDTRGYGTPTPVWNPIQTPERTLRYRLYYN